MKTAILSLCVVVLSGMLTTALPADTQKARILGLLRTLREESDGSLPKVAEVLEQGQGGKLLRYNINTP